MDINQFFHWNLIHVPHTLGGALVLRQVLSKVFFH